MLIFIPVIDQSEQTAIANGYNDREQAKRAWASVPTALGEWELYLSKYVIWGRASQKQNQVSSGILILVYLNQSPRSPYARLFTLSRDKNFKKTNEFQPK